MKNIKLRTIMIAVIAIIITIFSAGIVKAAHTDVTDMESKGKDAIGSNYLMGYGNIYHSTNTYCIQHHNTLHSTKTSYVIKNYIEIDGKYATVYSSKSSKGREVKSKYNAIMAYIFNQKEGYGEKNNWTESQWAIWYYSNKWTNTLFPDNNPYYWSKNDKSLSSKNSVANKAKEYAENIGNTRSTSDGKNLSMTDKTPNKDNVKRIDLGDGNYQIGPYKWEFDGKLKSINVKADNKKVSNVKFIKYKGKKAEEVDVKDIKSGDEFYIRIKDAKDTKTIKLKLKVSEKTTVETVKVWFLHSVKGYQNLVHVLPKEKKVEAEGEEEKTYTLRPPEEEEKPIPVRVGLQKVDDRGNTTPLANVGFTFRTTIQTYDLVDTIEHTKWVRNWEYRYDSKGQIICDSDGDPVQFYYGDPYQVTDWIENKYEWREHIAYINQNNQWQDINSNSAKIFVTNSDGIVEIDKVTYPQTYVTNRSREEYYNHSGTNVSGKAIDGKDVIATEVSNPNYGYQNEIGKEYKIDNIYGTQLLYNHQKYVKLSGYVWLEDFEGKQTLRDALFNEGEEEGINGIKVYLKNGNTVIKETTTSELGLYSEIENGEYQFVDVDLDALERGEYHIEYEYCGIKYQSVTPNIYKKTGSKASDSEKRVILDNKFKDGVTGNNTQDLNVNGVGLHYNAVNKHESELNNCTGCEIYASTSDNEARYNIYDDFEPTMEEIRYINLGLFEKAQSDFALAQDLYDVKVTVNGFEHIYRYATTRFENNGTVVNDETSWNVGVKFQTNSGTYSRAIYASDVNYIAANHKDNEMKVYITYKIALRNEGSYLGRINNIVDYCDNRYELISAGYSIDDNDQISNNIGYSQKTSYNDKYSKYIIDTSSKTINGGEEQYLYLQFRMNREAVLTVMNNGETLNNVAEINSYTTFDDDINKPLSVYDIDSVPGNTIPGQVDTYEDDTDAARSLKLEIANPRAVEGTVFVDSTGKDSNIYEGEERIGNGIFDNGEKTLEGVKVTLKEIGKDDNSYDGERVVKETETDKNGNFYFDEFVAGRYQITYTWGNNEYKVQYYKGTIYDESRNQNDAYWYKINANVRQTDALDSGETRKNIDYEMRKIEINTIESEIEKAYNGGSDIIKTTNMDSTTPTMNFSVEYETTITDGTKDEVKFITRNVDFGIVERAKQQLQVEKRITAIKVTLANGQLLEDAEIDENGKLQGLHKYMTYMGPSIAGGIKTNGTVKVEMDTELIQGATVELTYEIKVTNVGELDYVSDRYYYYGNKEGSDVVRASVKGLLDYSDKQVSVVNGEDKWQLKENTILTDVNASQKDDEDYINKINPYYTDKLSKDTDKLSKDLAPGESNSITLETSKLLTTSKDIQFDNKAEIVEVTKKNTFNSGTPTKVSKINEKGPSFSTNDAEKFIILPSTGENRDYLTPIVVGITTIALLGIGVFSIKKFVIDK